jgi:TPR repeat protein
MNLFKLISLLSLMLSAPLTFAQAPSEQACNEQNNGESCFYTGVEYIQAQGVAKDAAKAFHYFQKACDLAIPDGCNVLGYHYQNGIDVAVDYRIAAQHYRGACAKGLHQACDSANGLYLQEKYGLADKNAATDVWFDACQSGVLKMCQWGIDYLIEGREGYPEKRDAAAKMALKGCLLQDTNACDWAEYLYASQDSPQFEALEAMRILSINCLQRKSASCLRLGTIYHSIEVYEKAEFFYQQACDLPEEEGTSHKACAYAKDMRQYFADVEARERRIAELEALNKQRLVQLQTLLSAGDYPGAMAFAIDTRSVDIAAQATAAVNRAGAWSQINVDYLYILATWLQGSELAAVNAEMRRRGTGLEGTFGEGTNTPAQIAKRYAQANGGRQLPSAGSHSSFTPIAVPSSADVAKATRDKYRWAHCQMAGSNTSAKVCQ